MSLQTITSPKPPTKIKVLSFIECNSKKKKKKIVAKILKFLIFKKKKKEEDEEEEERINVSLLVA